MKAADANMEHEGALVRHAFVPRAALSLSMVAALVLGLLVIGHAPLRAQHNGVFKLSELIVEIVEEGTGPASEWGQTLRVEYTNWVAEGGEPVKIFDSSESRGAPWEFVLGARQAIEGWDEGLQGLKVGTTVRLTIPPKMAYGDRGFSGQDGHAPPGAWVISEITLLEAK